MNNAIKRMLAITLMLTMALGLAGDVLADEFVFGNFQLPTVMARPTSEPKPTPTPEPTPEPTPGPTVAPSSSLKQTGGDANGTVKGSSSGAAEGPKATPVPESNMDIQAKLNITLQQAQVLLTAGGPGLPIMEQPDGTGRVLAMIPNGEFFLVAPAREWSYAVYNGVQGYVRTRDVVLHSSGATPEEDELLEDIVRVVRISSSVDNAEVIYLGSEIVLTAHLSGFAEDSYSLQWQYSPDGGATILDIPEAHGMTFTFELDETNAAYAWRVKVLMKASDK